MPPLIAAVAGFLSVSLTTAAIITNVVLGIGVSLAVNGVAQLLTKKPTSASVATDLGSSTVSVRQALAPRQVTYGRDRRGGVFTYLIATGDNNEFLNMVITMNGHEVEDMPAMYFDGVEIPVDANGDGLGQYADTDGGGAWVHWEKKLGAPGEPAFPGLIAQVPSQWTVNHRQDGCASNYVRLRWSADLFPNGAPTITFDIKGKKVFDPRTGLIAYSENPAICTRDYLTDPTSGLAAPATEINDDLAIAAANICDQSISLRAGGSEPNFSLNGSFSTDTVIKDVLTGLLSAMGGTAVYSEGNWKIYAAAFRGTTLPTLTDNDLYDNMKVTTLLSRRDLSNCVKGVYRDPSQQWQPGDFPCVQNPQYICQDNNFSPTQNQGQWVSGAGYILGDCVFDVGNAYWCNTAHNSDPTNEPSTGSAVWTAAVERAWLDLAFAYTVSPSMSQRLAKIQLEKIRRQIDVQFPGRLKALRPEVCDVIPITRKSRFDWDHKLFECYNSQFKVYEGNDGVNLVGCDLQMRETDPAIYAWSPTSDETPVDFIGTEIQSGGGSTVGKYSWDSGEGAAGVQYEVSVVVDNNGSGNVFVDTGYAVSAPIPPGATQNIDITVTATGAHVLLTFETAVAGDQMDITAVEPIIARVSNGVNLIPVDNRDFTGWTKLNGANITLTQFAPTLPDMTVVGVPSNLVATSDTFTRADGIKKTRILAGWTSPTDQFVLSGGWINLEVRDHADMTWRFADRVAGNANTASYEEVTDGHTYDVRISSENASGARSTPVEADGLLVSDVFSQITSTSFGKQGSIRPTVFPVWTVATDSNDGAGHCTVRLTAPATSLPLTDGTSISQPAVDMTWSGVLAAVKTYLFYPRYKIADGTVHFATGTGVNVDADQPTVPLDTTASSAQRNQAAVNQNFDGYIPLTDGPLQVTTPNNGGAGGGSGGGNGACTHEEEPVEVINAQGNKEIVTLAKAQVGQPVRGRDLRTGEIVYRRIVRKQREKCNDWYEYKGRLFTPCETVWEDAAWHHAFALGVPRIGLPGYKVSLEVEGETSDDHNFSLMPKGDYEELVIHNGIAPS